MLLALTVLVVFQPTEGLLFNGGFIQDGFARYMKAIILAGSALALVLSVSNAPSKMAWQNLNIRP